MIGLSYLEDLIFFIFVIFQLDSLNLVMTNLNQHLQKLELFKSDF